MNIKRERAFIEATSRLASFKIESQTGILMSPIEFRLKPNKLDLIAKVLEVSPTAYQHQDMIIDLVNKLGYGEDLLVQIKALSMIVNSSMEHGNLLVGTETCERMISILESMKKRSRQEKQVKAERVEEACEVVWKTCERIGRYTGFGVNQASLKGFKTRFMAHAIIICPADQIARLLVECKEAEAAEVLLEANECNDELDRGIRSDTIDHGGTKWKSTELAKSMSDSTVMPSGGARGASLIIPGGDLASRTIERAASLFPFKSKTLPPLGGGTGAGSPKSKPGDSWQSTSKSNLLLSAGHSDVPPHSTSALAAAKPERDFSQPLSHLVDDPAGHPMGFGVGTDRLTTALSNKFTSGVGWLIGANEDELS